MNLKTSGEILSKQSCMFKKEAYCKYSLVTRATSLGWAAGPQSPRDRGIWVTAHNGSNWGSYVFVGPFGRYILKYAAPEGAESFVNILKSLKSMKVNIFLAGVCRLCQWRIPAPRGPTAGHQLTVHPGTHSCPGSGHIQVGLLICISLNQFLYIFVVAFLQKQR